jgi:MFS family permease
MLPPSLAPRHLGAGDYRVRLGIASLDATVVNIALPTIGRDFATGVAALQWVMNGYTLTLIAFLLVGGSLGDRFGRWKVYLIGIVWFTLASVACGLAPARCSLSLPGCSRVSVRRCSRREAWRSWKRRSCPLIAGGRFRMPDR